MAAPPSITTRDLSGTWVMNKALSDDTDEILRLQGDDSSVEHIDIEQKVTGVPGTIENRTLDWTFRENSDYLFGPILGRSRRVQLDEIDNEFLRNGWLPDTVELGAVNAYAKSDTPKSNTTWIANQIWGFEDINGERRYVRHVDFIGPKDEHIQARLVYDLYAAPS